MVQQINMPFTIDYLYHSDVSNPVPISMEEVNDIKETFTLLEQEKEELEYDLHHVSYEKNELKFDINQKEKQLYETEEKAEIERGKRKRTLGGLLSVEFNLDSLNQQLDVAQNQSRNWKRAWEKAMWEKNEVKGRLEAQISVLKISLEESQVSASREHHL